MYAAFDTEVEDLGLAFDYHYYEVKIQQLCMSLDKFFILPELCKYLSFSEKDNYYHVVFNHETMIFLKRDVKLLPIRNCSVEELSNWFIEQLIAEKAELIKNKISKITVKVFSAPGQGGSSTWQIT